MTPASRGRRNPRPCYPPASLPAAALAAILLAFLPSAAADGADASGSAGPGSSSATAAGGRAAASSPLVKGFEGQPPMTDEEIPLALDLVTVSRSPGATEDDFRNIMESFGLTEDRATFIMARAAAAILILDNPKNRERVLEVFGTNAALPTEDELRMVESYLKSAGSPE